jgi:hypothetical protein
VIPAPSNNHSEEKMLEVLPRAPVIADHAIAFLASHVDTLRKRDVTWVDIGKALGVSRQAARGRFPGPRIGPI